MRRETLLLLQVLRLSLLRLPLLLWSLLRRRRWRSSTPRGRPMTPVSPPPRGRRGGFRRKGVQRAVTSEVAGLTAFETGNHRGRGLVDRPTGRHAGKRLRGRLPARIHPTSTCLVPLLLCHLHRAPCDGHLLHKIKNFLCFVLSGPSHFELMLNLEFELGGIQPSHQRFTSDGCRTSFASTQRVTENAFSTGVFKVLLKAALDGVNPIYSSSFGSHGHRTADLSRRNRWVDRIFGPTFCALRNRLASIVFL